MLGLKTMPHLLTQSQYQRWPKPGFCYLCGRLLSNGTSLNDDHCPPQGMFAIEDRQNYPIKLSVHAECNHKWHLEDEKMAIFLDLQHGARKSTDSNHFKKLQFIDIENDQGTSQGITNFPMRPLVYRVIRCMHALLYGEPLPTETRHHVHYPIPEVDTSNGNKPVRHYPKTYQFANELCTAQRTNTHDAVRAYNGKFKYVCTWHEMDDGTPICLFAFDIYRMAAFAVKIPGFPQATIGSYAASKPKDATACSRIRAEHPDEDILYPIIGA